MHLLIMRRYVALRVPLVRLVLDTDALLATDLEPLDPPEQLGALPGKHGPNNELDTSPLFLLRQFLQVRAVLQLAWRRASGERKGVRGRGCRHWVAHDCFQN